MLFRRESMVWLELPSISGTVWPRHSRCDEFALFIQNFCWKAFAFCVRAKI